MRWELQALLLGVLPFLKGVNISRPGSQGQSGASQALSWDDQGESESSIQALSLATMPMQSLVHPEPVPQSHDEFANHPEAFSLGASD